MPEFRKFVPVIVIEVPAEANEADKLVIVGGGKVKLLGEELAVPPLVVTVMKPDEPPPTVAVICVILFIVKEEAFVGPNFTAVAPVKFVPVITTFPPEDCVEGVKLVIVGAAIVNPALAAVPPGVVTCILPFDPAPTTAVI